MLVPNYQRAVDRFLPPYTQGVKMKPAKFQMRIPADKHGFRLVEDMKMSLNRQGYKLIIRYSGKRRTYFGGHTRKEDATSMRVYIEPVSVPVDQDVFDYYRAELTRINREKNELASTLGRLKEIISRFTE